MSLRSRLVLGMLVLLVAAIVTTDVVTSASVRSFLYGRVDEQVEAAQDIAYSYISSTYAADLAAGNRLARTDQTAWLSQLGHPTPGIGIAKGHARPLRGESLSARLGPDVYAEVLGPRGNVIYRRPSGSSTRPDDPPVLPAVLPVQRAPIAHQFGRLYGTFTPAHPAFDVEARGSKGEQYRVEAVAVPGGVLLTAMSLQPTTQTLRSLTNIEVAVSAVVVLALVMLALWIVQLGLRPLADMTATAGAIAAGDLTRRIGRSDERNEVGRLGAALNGMLSQIESAFAERTASESRLRRFVADASHELRTPLTSIRGYAELLRKGALDDEAGRRRAAERIEHEAARMSLLVDDLLLLARLDQGLPLERARVDLGRVAHDAVDAARAVDPEHPVTVVTEDDVDVAGDDRRLRQVADNLIRNAQLHTPPSTPVRVVVRRVRGAARLEVADEGPGLTPEQQSKVFDRFWRGSEARTGEGTGLGLSIVAALAEAHGGRAMVESRPGHGAVFAVELPLAVAPAPRASPLVSGEAARAPATSATVSATESDLVPGTESGAESGAVSGTEPDAASDGVSEAVSEAAVSDAALPVEPRRGVPDSDREHVGRPVGR